MRALQAWSDNRIDGDSIIMKVLTRMKEHGLGTTEEFEKIHGEIRAEWARESNSQRGRWEFFIPFVAKLADDMPRAASVTLLDTAFVFDKWEDAEGKLGPENVKRAFANDFLKVEQRPETCLSLTAEGVNSIHAWNGVTPAFDLFRGLLEYIYGFGRRSMIFGGGNKSKRATFPIPKWLLARSANQAIEVLRFDTNALPTTAVQTLNAQGFGQLVTAAGRFSTPSSKNSTTTLLADAFRIYAQALDEPFRHTCLLGLWQMAETLTLSNRGDTRIVCARLVATVERRMQPPPTGLPEILDDIAVKRNRMVHNGIHDIDDDDINILKLICEMALRSVMQAADKLPTKEHLNHFLALSCRAKTDLQTMGEALNWIYELEKKLSAEREDEDKLKPQ